MGGIAIAAITLTLMTSALLFSVFGSSQAVAQTLLERTQMRGLPTLLLSGDSGRDVNDRTIRRDGSDAVALGLIGKKELGDAPYFGNGDYYGKGDYFTVDTPPWRCRE
jgi:hypothetical protein